MIERIFYISFAIIFIFQIQIFPQTKPADLVIFNANVRTLDEKKPKAEAVRGFWK